MLVNLHSHLEGRVRPSTAAELGSAAEVPELRVTQPGDLTAYLAVVSSTYPFFGRPDWISRIVREAIEDAADDGQQYLELRFGPVAHVHDRQSLRDVIAAACEGLADGVRHAGIESGLVIAALRKHDAEVNLDLARTAATFAGRGVVGFDLSGNEQKYPELARHTPAFALARAAGLGLTAHAAEAAPGRAVREAVERFGVTRIGHGTHLATDPETLRWAADSGIVIEVCPTSNRFTGAIPRIQDHPAPLFRDAGIPLVLGDDNPIQTASPLSAEHEILSTTLGFTAADLTALDETSRAAVFR